ncbi:hypothetical protein PG994_000809 [Apiospora phragmitis]|uniref:Amine oxidase n=1 Tax=Apiospora phragmitis TaxID=2905665 RepID=A0ABR1X7G6_9PEZI
MRPAPSIVAIGLFYAGRAWTASHNKCQCSEVTADTLFRRQSSASACPVPQDVAVTAPRGTPFTPLSQSELDSIVEWLGSSEHGLNLSDPSRSTLAMSDNYISHIETLKPNKTDVTDYLSGASDSVPRYARVVINEGAATAAGGGGDRRGDHVEHRGHHAEPHGAGVLRLRRQPDEQRVLRPEPLLDRRHDGRGLAAVAPARQGPVDQPSDLYVSFDIAGTDPSLYRLRMIVYDLVVYNSTDDFRAAWSAGEITKTPDPTTNDSFLNKDRVGTVRDLEDRFAPTVLALQGKRYRVDNGEQLSDLHGLVLLQKTGTAYSDRFYGIGGQVVRPIPGYDCPYHATYWNATFNDGTGVSTISRAICIFETDIGVPLTRHNVYNSWSQSTKGSKLVVRMIATLGNYDYIWDYGFVVDGSISVDAYASGYVQANYYRPDDAGRWGPRIGSTISGTLHTHVMNLKADFDLVDSRNTFVTTNLVVENVTQPWYPERGVFETMRYAIRELASEAGGRQLPNPPNGQAMYTVVNKARPNAWGESRGYRILPGLSNVCLPSQNSPFFRRSGEHAKQVFAVSRQHDTEPAATAALSGNVPEAPLVAFWGFFADDEPLEQEDLVVWANLGMQHFVRAEDLPNTLAAEAHASVVFAPQNWGDGGEHARPRQCCDLQGGRH